MKTIDIRNNQLQIRFSDPDQSVFFSLVGIVKTLSGRSFLKDSRMWTAPVTENNIRILKEAGFDFNNGVEKLLQKSFKMERIMPEINEDILNGLFPFQIEGVRFLAGRNGTGIIGDAMGLGKTIQALGYLKLHPELRPALIVCPASVKLNWKREIEKWLPNEFIQIVWGKKPSLLGDASIFIINYDILFSHMEGKQIKGWCEVFKKKLISVVIADEIQYITNPKAQRTKAFRKITRMKGIKKILLSGTPIKNRPSEFFTALNLIAPEIFPNRWNYLHTYCDPKHTGFGWVFKGLTVGKEKELFDLIYPLMIRREKNEVLKDLPDKIKTIIPLTVDDSEFKKYEKAYLNVFKKDIKKIQLRNECEALKQIAYACKRDSVLNWISDFLNSDEKLVIFAYHRKVLDDLENKFKNISVRIDGGVPAEKRQELVDKFQNDSEIKLFLGQITAAGVGITLTAASSVAFVEFGWTPSDHVQAEDRCHRIGQKDSVNVYYLVAENTIEIKIVELLQEKGRIIGQVLDGKEKEFIPGDIFDKLIGG